MIRTFVTAASLAALAAAGPAAAIGTQATQQAQPQTSSGNAPVLAAQDGGYGQARSNDRGFLGGILGCSAEGNKQGIAAAIGGVAGGLLGNRIAGSGSRTLGTLIGGALGAAAGSAVGCKLQRNDRDKAERAAQAALDTGTSQSWRNEETGASGRVDVVNGTSDGAGLGNLRFASGVEPAGNYVKIGESYTTSSSVNLRGAPSTSAAVRATLPAGQRVWVPAQVKGQPWMLVSENGVGQGYVSAALLKRSTLVAANSCKMVTQSVSVPGEAEQAETYQACKGNDGQWTMTRV
ncbi:SH3 domain-containing protein [Sphingobium nicotianae]|uniref:17 kDa surface antigen n=1 Tax=Sphingobium nicotianae TaxID=2782607 RepID=A0A9X1ISU6_9SPHN|nr:SH3 domain-containing protein [Sphingobium nicotianae]MBT2188697.1 SH3 domain-containing protein [Sphingobium nicotianae]